MMLPMHKLSTVQAAGVVVARRQAAWGTKADDGHCLREQLVALPKMVKGLLYDARCVQLRDRHADTLL